MKNDVKTPPKTGPKEERVKLKGNWEKRIKKALGKKRPKAGWPKEK